MMIKMRFTALASVVALTGLAACTPDAPPPPPLPSAATTYRLSTGDAAFLQSVDALDLAQSRIAGLAASHSNNGMVKAFAATVMGDHDANRKTVAKIASGGNLTVTDKLNAADEAHVSSFDRLYGAAFDRAFLADVRALPAASVSHVLSAGAQSGGTADIKGLAADTTKMLQDHAVRAQNMGGSSTMHRRGVRHHR